jgi:ribosomal 30S subunit maturation factor RimM
MEIAPADIAKGMQVYSTDGEKLGTVAEVYTGTPAEIEAAGSNDAADATGTLYIKVEHGGVLGLGARDLYIPFTAVTEVAAGEAVTVNGTKDECSARYGNKPDVLGS